MIKGSPIHWIIVLLISMVPLVELRGAIPYAEAFQLRPIWLYILIIAVGNMLPVPFIFFFARKVLEWGADKKFIGPFFSWCLRKGERGGEKLTKKTRGGVYVALMLFVGIPLPGTGAWTGTLAASILDLDFKKSVLAVIAGVAIAGTIMLAGSFGLFSGIRALFM